MKGNMLGLPIEFVVFAGVILLMAALAPFILKMASTDAQILRRAEKLKSRSQKGPAKDKTGDAEEEARSLRRMEGDSSLPLLTALLSRLSSIHLLRYRLARSGLPLTAERYMLYCAVLFLVTLVVLKFILAKGMLLSALIAIIVGLGVPHIVINFLIGRQLKVFLTQFPDAIDLIVRGLKAGLPVTESIKMVSREIEAPVGEVFQSMTEKMALGVPLEKTLYQTAEKFRITEFDFFVTSIVLQRETGGNLSEILQNLSEALRARLMMKLKIKAMSSEARASMYIIGALPFLVSGALMVTSPDYLTPLFEDYRGNISLGVAMGMLGTGIFIMMRLGKFEI